MNEFPRNPKFIDLSELKVPKEDFDNLLRSMSKDIAEKQINNIVEEVNKVLSNYPYPEKDKSHEKME
jgi:hypothetical protein